VVVANVNFQHEVSTSSSGSASFAVRFPFSRV